MSTPTEKTVAELTAQADEEMAMYFAARRRAGLPDYIEDQAIIDALDAALAPLPPAAREQ